MGTGGWRTFSWSSHVSVGVGYNHPSNCSTFRWCTQTPQNVSYIHTQHSIDTLGALLESAIEWWSAPLSGSRFVSNEFVSIRSCPVQHPVPCCTRSHAVQDPVLCKIPCCTRSCAVQDPMLYEIPCCARSCAVQDPTLYKIPHCTRSRAAWCNSLNNLVKCAC